MSDFGEAVARVRLVLQKAGASGNAAGDSIRMALRHAILQQRHNHFQWNVGDLSITPLVVSQLVYNPGATASDVPLDMLYPTGNTRLYIRDTAVGTRLSMSSIAESEYQGLRLGTAVTDGPPRYVCWIGKDLHILPGADATTYEIYGHYVKDITLPTATESAGVWTFEADSHTSAWFVEGQGLELITYTAAREVAVTWFADMELAGAVQILAQEQQARHMQETEMKRSSGSVTPYISSLNAEVYGESFEVGRGYLDWMTW